jgi:hypothetical protein
VQPCPAEVEDEVHMECTESIVIYKLSSWGKKRLSVIETKLEKKPMLPKVDTPRSADLSKLSACDESGALN